MPFVGRRLSGVDAERRAEPGGEHVVAEVLLGAAAGGDSHLAATSVVGEQRGERVDHGVDGPAGARVADDDAGLAVGDRFGRSPAVAGDLRHAASSRFDEDDAEALLLEPAPPVAACHGHHVAHGEHIGQVVVADPAEKGGRRIGRCRQTLEPTPIADPVLASLNRDVAELVGLDVEGVDPEHLAREVVGEDPIEGLTHLADLQASYQIALQVTASRGSSTLFDFLR